MARSLAQARVAAGTVEDGSGEGARLGGAVAQDLVDVVEVGGEFGAAGAGRPEAVPVVFEAVLLEQDGVSQVNNVSTCCLRAFSVQEGNGVRQWGRI